MICIYYIVTTNSLIQVLLAIYFEYVNVFNEDIEIILLLLRKELSYNINLQSKITSFFDSLYNLLELELIILKNYIE